MSKLLVAAAGALFFGWAFLLSGFVRSAESAIPPDLSQLPACQTPMAHPDTARADYNLGATGMRGWIFGSRNDSAAAREILVRVVEKGSPADGIFSKFDLITGIDGKPFSFDAREALAAALTQAEVTGTLDLLRWRDGRETSVTLKMETLGAYSPTAPYDCPKTTRIIANSAEYITTRLLPEKPTPEGVARALNALFLLATGEAKYLPQIRRYARDFAAEMDAVRAWSDARSRWTWNYGYKNLFLTEYYLATGDVTVLPAVENICSILAQGQGIPGAWCHGLSPEANIMPGYGAVNSTGLVCFISMALAQEAGAYVDEKALADSFAFFGSFAGRGGIPYGDHPPYNRSPSTNGKSGLAAVAFTVMKAPRAAQWFSRLSASSNAFDIYSGHTGNYWNHTWTPIGAFLAGRKSFVQLFRRVRGNYELMRRWDHGYVTNPDYSRRECYAARRKYGGPYWGPGAFSLFMTAPRERLRIFGARPGIFAGDACPVKLEGALELYRALAYRDCLDVLDSIRLNGGDEAMRRQLRDAAASAIAANSAGLAAARASLAGQDFYLASVRANALTGVMDSDTPGFSELRAALATQDAREQIEKGEAYYLAANTYAEDHIRFLDEYRISPFACISPNHRSRLQRLVEDQRAGIYRGMAKTFLEQNPLHPYQRIRHEWLPTSEYSPLTPIFNCAAAREKDVPNTDVETLSFSADPGERIPALNPEVEIQYLLYESDALRAEHERARKPVEASWAGLEYEGWQSGVLPIGTVKGKPADRSRILPRGHSSRVRIQFSIDDPMAYSEWFITCKATGTAEFYLNGTLILRMDPDSRSGYRIVHLKPASAALFQPGENILGVDVGVSDRRKTPFLDIGLDALAKQDRAL